MFISYHHARDQARKDELVEMGKRHSVFLDRSVDDGDIPEEWTPEQIRREIRDEYLRDSTVTIVLVGAETRRRKHVDWEIHSSMYDGSVNRRSGIVVIPLPGFGDAAHAAYGDEEKRLLYPDIRNWVHISDWEEMKSRHPYLPDRIIDNLVVPEVTISVAPWKRINEDTLRFLIDAAFRNRFNCKFDLRRPMRQANS